MTWHTSFTLLWTLEQGKYLHFRPINSSQYKKSHPANTGTFFLTKINALCFSLSFFCFQFYLYLKKEIICIIMCLSVSLLFSSNPDQTRLWKSNDHSASGEILLVYISKSTNTFFSHMDQLFLCLCKHMRETNPAKQRGLGALWMVCYSSIVLF